MAIAEPALSFEFDSSQSLFEQLTRAQQATNSNFRPGSATPYSASASPVVRAAESMPPPQIVPQQLPTPADDGPTSNPYSQMPLPSTQTSNLVKQEQHHQQNQLYDRVGLAARAPHYRHVSVPSYLEYSPAPSFASSHLDDYSHRGMSYEPITPPQSGISLTSEPSYIAGDDASLYGGLSDIHALSGGLQMQPQSMSQGYGSAHRYSNSQGGSVYAAMEGSPTYKQRRRRSSINQNGPPMTVTTNVPAAHSHPVHRPSDLRRSLSYNPSPHLDHPQSNMETSMDPNLVSSNSLHMPYQKDLLQLSRQNSPLPSLDGSHLHTPNPLMRIQTDFADDGHRSPSTPGMPGAIRRARSATVAELGPYSQKSHSCPIPSCGRTFKRLEHLKRLVHTSLCCSTGA